MFERDLSKRKKYIFENMLIKKERRQKAYRKWSSTRKGTKI